MRYTINRKTKSYTIYISFSVSPRNTQRNTFCAFKKASERYTLSVSSSISKDILFLFSIETLVKKNKTYIFLVFPGVTPCCACSEGWVSSLYPSMAMSWSLPLNMCRVHMVDKPAYILQLFLSNLTGVSSIFQGHVVACTFLCNRQVLIEWLPQPRRCLEQQCRGRWVTW